MTVSIFCSIAILAFENMHDDGNERKDETTELGTEERPLEGLKRKCQCLRLISRVMRNRFGASIGAGRACSIMCY